MAAASSSNPQNTQPSNCHLVCHWGGEMVQEPEGINYLNGNVRVLLVKPQMRFSEIIQEIHEFMKIDQNCVDLKLVMRIQREGIYTAVPLHDDNSLKTMWSSVSQMKKIFIEVYIEQVPITATVAATPEIPVLNHVDVNNASVDAKQELTNGAPPHVKSLMSNSKKLQDELQKIGSLIKHHEDNLKLLKTLKSKLDEVILDLQVGLGKSVSSSTPAAAEGGDNHHVRSEEETVQQILKHGNSAAAIYYQLKTHHGSQLSNHAMLEDVLGAAATLGKVDDDNLSRLFSKYLGLQTMLAIVCKTHECVRALEKWNDEGLVNKGSGIHGLGASIGQILEGRFNVICLDELRPCAGEVLANDPQRRIDIPKPRLPTGVSPAGFLGYAVNMIHLDRTHLSYVTSSGFGLRETLFYNLFSRLQVYRTRAEMLLALPFITDAAVSLDGGMIKARGVFSLGKREDVDVRFPIRSEKSDFPANYYELEKQMKQNQWEREMILGDMRREQALLDREKYNFSLIKQDLTKLLADSSGYVSQHQMQTAAQGRQEPVQ